MSFMTVRPSLAPLAPSPRAPAPLARLAFAVAAVAAVAGCAIDSGAADSTAQQARAVVAGPGLSLASMPTRQYITIDGDHTGLVNVADDGRYTYLAFQGAAPPDLEVFDADGAPLENLVRQGRIAAVAAVPRGGLLLRLRGPGEPQANHSFVAPNPRAQASDLPDLDADPELVEARGRLEHLTIQGPAFRRAIERAQAHQRDGRRPGAVTAGWPLATTTGLPLTVPGRAPAAADAAVQRTPRGNLIRIYFASGGRAIVRPDDGLGRLEQEAEEADEIHVTGFADAQGSEAVNAELARGRAEAIQALLIKRGIPAQRIVVNWHGRGRYLADNATEQGRAMNRRVEVLFVRAGREGLDHERYSAR